MHFHRRCSTLHRRMGDKRRVATQMHQRCHDIAQHQLESVTPVGDDCSAVLDIKGDVMNSTAMLKQMADYSHWMNQRLYTVCAGMKDEERKCDLNTFFRSIHGTLNHILLVDRLWFARIHNET